MKGSDDMSTRPMVSVIIIFFYAEASGGINRLKKILNENILPPRSLI